jgi:hypothetical protein
MVNRKVICFDDYGNLDNKLWTRLCFSFRVEMIKAIVKKKRTLAFYTLHTIVYDKKDLFIGGWVDLGQLLLISCSSRNGAV